MWVRNLTKTSYQYLFPSGDPMTLQGAPLASLWHPGDLQGSVVRSVG